jgi:predicted protein tyrosine phosphatase
VQKAGEMEAREGALQAAEEATLRHREEVEAAGAGRAEEAQAAIARLQAEFAHQLAIEHARGTELQLQREHAQQELQAAQVRAA